MESPDHPWQQAPVQGTKGFQGLQLLADAC